jgi:isopenicillin N synthase-like dioxygenase
VRNVLKALGVNEHLYSQATGGLSDTNGKVSLKACHYDPRKQTPGIAWHKDIRWITVLYINQEGLEASVDKQVVNVDPKQGYFVVNLGVYFEAFIDNAYKVVALPHQVRQMNNDRISFGVFCEGDYPQKGIYQLSGGQLLFVSPEKLNDYLIKDEKQLFSTKPHNVFNQYKND